MKSILIINHFGIGDVLFTTPLIRNVKQQIKDVRLGFLCSQRAEPVLRHNPFLDYIIVYNWDYFADFKDNIFLYVKKHWEFINKIREHKPKTALDFSLNTQFSFLAWAAGIKQRIGFDYRKRSRFLTEKITVNGYKDKHVADYYGQLLKFIGVEYNPGPFEIYLPKENEDFAEDFFVKNNLSGKLVIGISPAGGDSWGKDAYRRHWPRDKFSSLIVRIKKELPAEVLVFGSKNEKEIVNEVVNRSLQPVLKIAGIDILKYLALLKRVDLLVCNDGGPLHLAKAVGVKTVSIFGPVDPKVYGPYPFDSNKDIIIKKGISCQPCYNNFRLPECQRDLECLKSISVEEVFGAVKKLINN